MSLCSSLKEIQIILSSVTEVLERLALFNCFFNKDVFLHFWGEQGSTISSVSFFKFQFVSQEIKE